MLSKLNNKIDDLITELNQMKKDENNNVLAKLKQTSEDINIFMDKTQEFKEWIDSGIYFLDS